MDGRSRLLLHFHGGLVEESAGLATAKKMAAHYGDVSASIGLVWETGLIEILRDSLSGIARLPAFRKALSWVIAKTAARLSVEDGVKGATGGSLDPLAIQAALETEAGVDRLDAALVAEAQYQDAERTARDLAGAEELLPETLQFELEIDLSQDPEFLNLVMSETGGGAEIARRFELHTGEKSLSIGSLAWFIAKVILAVVRRYRNRTHHDLLPTAVEELLRAAYLGSVGQFAWEEMKRKALLMWQDDGPEPGVEAHVGGYILRRLEALQTARPDLVVDLVGHSAGSIAIGHMLAAIENQPRNIRIRNIVFLAPAIRLDAFAARFVRRPPQFASFRSFTMCDDWEKADKLVGAIYPRSLLFFISGLLEDRAGTPLAGLARHVAGRTAAAADYEDVRQWLASENRLVLAPTLEDALEGLRTRSHQHGYFDDDPVTLSSLLHLARS
jgi:hypothetical protein